MSQPPPSSSPSRMENISPNRAGMIAGAIAGAIIRFAVAVAFVVYVHTRQSEWWGGMDQAGIALVLSLLSGVIGFVIGGIAGYTSRPIVGSLVGAVLSAGSCFFLFVLPTDVMLSMSGGGGRDYTAERSANILGLIAMTLAGAIAGAIGGAVGSRRKNSLAAIP